MSIDSFANDCFISNHTAGSHSLSDYQELVLEILQDISMQELFLIIPFLSNLNLIRRLSILVEQDVNIVLILEASTDPYDQMILTDLSSKGCEIWIIDEVIEPAFVVDYRYVLKNDDNQLRYDLLEIENIVFKIVQSNVTILEDQKYSDRTQEPDDVKETSSTAMENLEFRVNKVLSILCSCCLIILLICCPLIIKYLFNIESIPELDFVADCIQISSIIVPSYHLFHSPGQRDANVD
ncbi:MAG: hypothetical protein RTU92_04335 [Candidatus Thorarchaeota archaeon]